MLKKITGVLLALCILIVAASGCTTAEDNSYNVNKVKVSASDISKVESKVDGILTENEFNGSASITLNKQVIYNKTAGYADGIKQKKLNGKSPYQINCLTKQFTAMAVLLLEKEGRLSLSDTLDKYFGIEGNRSYLSNISVENLLNSNISFGSYTDEIAADQQKSYTLRKYSSAENLKKYEVETSNFIINHILANGYSKQKNSTSSNYYLLGKIITSASGTSYRKYVKEKIFDKLGMNNTGFTGEDYKLAGFDMDNKVWHRNGEYPAQNNFGYMYSSFGIISCSDDMSKFYVALIKNTLGVDLFRKIKYASSTEAYGFKHDGNNISASGRTRMYAVYVHINVEHNEAVVMLSNYVGKRDIVNTGELLYNVISSKVNGIILSSVKTVDVLCRLW